MTITSDANSFLISLISFLNNSSSFSISLYNQIYYFPNDFFNTHLLYQFQHSTQVKPICNQINEFNSFSINMFKKSNKGSIITFSVLLVPQKYQKYTIVPRG